jgi:uncharacterized protein (DUF885 family)
MEQTVSAPAFDAWLDEFFAAYYQQNPVSATFIGVHDFDDLLPDLTSRGREERRGQTESLLRRLHSLPEESLGPAQRVDRTLAEGQLEISLWEQDSAHFAHGNPSAPLGEASFGAIGLFLRPFAPLRERAENAVARLVAIPAFLAAARESIDAAPPAWTAKARRECDGALAFLTGGIDVLAAESDVPGASLRAAADIAAEAVRAYAHWLDTELVHRPSGAYATGEEALELIVRRAHCSDASLADLERDAEEELARAAAWLREHAGDFRAGSPQEVLARLADLHPTAEGYYAAYGDVWEAARATAIAHDLVTWPDFPIEFVPQPEWAREAAPLLYFLFYRSPAAFDNVLPVQYLVTPIEQSMPADEVERRLRATNDSVIKLNHVVHHGGIGHHVQNWNAFRAGSRIGRMAAVDCASRIAMLCGGSMAEGWACYATQLMEEVGFLTRLEEYAEQHTLLRMAARALSDLRLHSGRWTLEQAAAFYQETVFMSPAAAESEAVKNSMFPGTALMYRLGVETIRSLRRDAAAREGASFQLDRFHDRLLSYGSIPPALIARSMREEGTVHAE